MRLLLDTNILVPLIDRRLEELPLRVRALVAGRTSDLLASVGSIWEIAIKHRLGKLPIEILIARIPEVLRVAGIDVLPIEASHALAEADPVPATRDPFDRLLLAQCAVEDLRLVTLDRALAAHPLAWKPAPAG